MSNKMHPIHLEEILDDKLEELGLSTSALAVLTNRITFILNGKRTITVDSALRLA